MGSEFLPDQVDIAENDSWSCICCYLKNFWYNLKKSRITLEIIIIVFTCLMLILKVNEFIIQNIKLYVELLIHGNRIFILVSLVSIMLVVLMRFLCNREGEDILSVILIVCLVFYFTYFAKWRNFFFFFLNDK